MLNQHSTVMVHALILLLGAWNCHAAAMRIRVINSKNGKPKAGISLRIEFIGGPGRRPDLPAPGLIEAETDPSGLAIVDIEEIPHRRFMVFFPGLCFPAIPHEVENVLQAAAIDKNQCWHKSPKLSSIIPTPGELVVFWDSLSFFERFKHTELWP